MSLSHRLVLNRRSSWACIGSPKLEQETIEGTHAQDSPAYQRRPTTLHEVQGSSPNQGAIHAVTHTKTAAALPAAQQPCNGSSGANAPDITHRFTKEGTLLNPSVQSNPNSSLAKIRSWAVDAGHRYKGGFAAFRDTHCSGFRC